MLGGYECRNPLSSLLWIAGSILQFVVTAVLIYRKTWLNFPLFTGYIVFNFIYALVALATRARPPVYFYVYWIGEAIGIILGFMVVYEVFQSLFLHHSALRKVAALIFTISSLALVALALFILFMQGLDSPEI